MKNEIQNMTREQFGKKWVAHKAEFLADVGATLALLGGPVFDPEEEWEKIIDLEYEQYLEDQIAYTARALGHLARELIAENIEDEKPDSWIADL